MKDGKHVDEDGIERWSKDGELHREDGPAVIRITSETWYQNGKLHREDGPAVVRKNIWEEWWLYEKELYFVDSKRWRINDKWLFDEDDHKQSPNIIITFLLHPNREII
jgi:hypothetical protein